MLRFARDGLIWRDVPHTKAHVRCWARLSHSRKSNIVHQYNTREDNGYPSDTSVLSYTVERSCARHPAKVREIELYPSDRMSCTCVSPLSHC